jgi:hypothetical protein
MNKNQTVWILWGEDPEDKPTQYSFKTREELKAFLWGVAQSQGWWDYSAIVQEEKPKLAEFHNYRE